MKIDRLFSELVYLINRDVVTAREMADHFEVSVRTVQRDMDTLALAGIPLLSLRGAQGGYGIMKEYKLDRQLMNTHDLFFILTSLESISSTLKNKDMRTTLDKMKTLIRDYQQTEILSRKEQLHIDFSAFSIGKNSHELFSILQKSIENRTLITFGYTNNHLEMTKRVVEPMTILFKWFSWYLYGFCRLRNDFRLFRLSRMENVRPIYKYFTRRDKTVVQFMKEMDTKAEQHAMEITLRFHPSAKAHIGDYLKDGAMDTDSEGYIILKLAMPEDEWLYGMILSYGDMVEVLEPPHLKRMILEKSLQILRKYQTLKNI
ncbi:MAG: YafY family transcriptional regulator [Deltaproteobacteria bacterium]|nr:YafY family transcriptional regulator [Deltaproteobacteria bacterium]